MERGEKKPESSEKRERFYLPGQGWVWFTHRHSCRSLRASHKWEKFYALTHYVRTEHVGKFYRVYTRRKK